MGFLSDTFSQVDFVYYIEALKQGGWYDIMFPFLLVYAVVFTILEKVKIFKTKKPVRVIIAFIFALFAVSFPISESGATLGYLLTKLFPGVSAFSLGVLSLYIVLAMLGVDLTEFFGNNSDKNQYIKYVIGGLGLIVVIYYYGLGFEWWGYGYSGTLDWLIGPGGLLRDPMLYILAIGGYLMYWISSDENQDPKNPDNHSSKKEGSDSGDD